MGDIKHHGLETLAPLFFRTSISICSAAAILVSYRIYSVWRRRGWFGPEDGMAGVSLVRVDSSPEAASTPFAGDVSDTVISTTRSSPGLESTLETKGLEPHADFFLIVITTIGCEAGHYGFGYHIRDIPTIGGDKAKALLCFWLFQIFYKIVICCNKLAFLFLYLQLFPQRSIRRICWASIVVVVTGSFSFVMSTVLECLPVSRNWNKTAPGHCINNTAFRWSWAGFNTLTDLWVLLLPIPVILKLQMSLLKRVGASIIFLLGMFIVGVSCFRMKALVQSVSKNDTTWDSAPAFIWSHVEAAVGLIATCLPALKQPISKLLPKRITGTAASTPVPAAQYRLRTFSGKLPASLSGGSMGYDKERNSVRVTTHPEVDTTIGRESQERMLNREPGILVTKDISIQSANIRDSRG